jgi:hypothetical protein
VFTVTRHTQLAAAVLAGDARPRFRHNTQVVKVCLTEAKILLNPLNTIRLSPRGGVRRLGRIRKDLAWLVLLVPPLALSGCGNMFARYSPPTRHEASIQASIQKARAARQQRAAEKAMALSDSAYPNINIRPPEPRSRLLSPAQRARVIAELEALANRQGASFGVSSGKSRNTCVGDAARSLDPAARLKLEQQGWKC